MSQTPRKSSVRSTATRRAPASLRLPTFRKASTQHLSLVFAEHDRSDGDSKPRNNSEEVLARTLDSDTGGRQIGLRSRSGSSTTILTARSPSGVANDGPLSPTSSVREEDEGEAENESEAQAGPSRIGLGRPEASPVQVDNTGIRLNPKSSSSWLRWNSPAPTFPRSRSNSTRKGKQREEPELAPSVNPITSDIESPARSPQPASTEPIAPRLAPPVPQVDDTPQTAASVPPPTPRQSRWWSRKTPTPSIKQIEGDAKTTSTDSATVIEDIVPKTDVSASPQSVKPIADLASASTVPQPPPPSSSINSPPEATPAAQSTPLQPPPAVDKTLATPSSWKTYIGLNDASKARSKPLSSKPSSLREQPIPEQESAATEVDAQPSIPPPIESPTVQPTSEPALPKDNLQPVEAEKPGWGSYLYSFVANPIPPPIQSTSVTPSIADGPAESADSSAVSSTLTETAPEPDIPSAPGKEVIKLSAPTSSAQPPSSRKPSSASQTGWLNYLAFRASEKKITNSSTASIKSGKNGVVSEDVMDFSTDPDFPAAEAEPAKDAGKKNEFGAVDSGKKDGAGKTGETGKSEIDKKDETGKTGEVPKPQNSLAVRNRKASHSSIRSTNNPTPLSSSPQTTSATKPTPKAPSSSSLPPPPAPPAAQPNLVIPSFSSTFDRPPRSLPPRTPPSDKGIAAATTGLAWKALGAVGSYVYRQDEPKAEVQVPRLEQPGDNLPKRLLGLDGDEDWKGIKRVVVVGVHGWFPAKMLNSVIGEPTGTSVKFANMMGQAVRRFFDDKGIDDIRLTLMPLEGEGTIDSRVDRLYKAYLSNPAWINDLRRADAVFFAAHSQGCIVTTHLISRMIAQGHIRTPLNTEAVFRCEWAFGPIGVVPDSPKKRGARATGAEGGDQKVAMLAMCGVHLGPLHYISNSTVIHPYLQWFENAAARELFEFQDSTSAVSLEYQKALSMVLENEVKVVLLASLNDQVVPIYGASFSTASHPLLLRALFVDGASYSASDFMTNLLCFAFMLRNAGIDDQRLVEHLSEATAGGLTGVGHSAPYEDPGCYDLTVSYLFLSGSAKTPSPPLSLEPFSAREPRNDFELPWIMRALVDSVEVRGLFPAELKELKEGVIQWRPTTKALKEIKKRLEPMAGRQSKLRTLASSPSSTSINEMPQSPGRKPANTSALRKDW